MLLIRNDRLRSTAQYEKEKQNLEVVENQAVAENSTMTLQEQTKVAEQEEKTQAELDLMRTKLGHKRVIHKLITEEGFEVDELADQKRMEHELAIENETVKENLQRRTGHQPRGIL